MSSWTQKTNQQYFLLVDHFSQSSVKNLENCLIQTCENLLLLAVLCLIVHQYH